MLRRILLTGSAATLALAGLVGTAGPAAAANVACGQTITVSTVLDADIGPCTDGVTIGADGITFDLGGHTITGSPSPGDGPGVHLVGRTGVTVRNGTVTGFDAGVAVEEGSANTVASMRLINNVGANFTDFGDGVVFFDTTGNVVRDSVAMGNGPFSGMSALIGNHNTFDHNQILNNNVSSSNTAGIRLENIGHTASNFNVVTNNLVQNSGIYGIELFAGASDNTVRANSVVGNALDGITVFAGGARNTIEANSVAQNRANGISVRGAAGTFPAPSGNRILRNSSLGNAQRDLFDGTPACGTNVWSGNRANTGSPPCVFNP